MEKVLILGGRRGLGGAVTELWAQKYPKDELTVTSRREFSSSLFKTLKGDLAQDADVGGFIKYIQDWRPDRVFCFAGGGPFGPFAEKNWKDHYWGLKVSLLSPLQLMHEFMRQNPQGQWIMTGSAVAEEMADPNAASYAASKHALKGAISSLKAENPAADVRLFSPGYMDTEMLPVNSAARLQKILAPRVVAAEFIDWARDPKASWHKVCRHG